MSQEIGELEELINQGRYFEARSRADDGLKNKLDNQSRLKQLLALAISKSGMPELALETINPLYNQFPDDPESAGILGSIYKELFKKNQKTSFAVQSRDTYLKNFQATDNYYTGINAASMSAMAGQGSKGREIASQVIAIVEKLPTGFWELATLGEAYLIIKNKTRSIEYYLQARKLAGNDWGNVTSVYNQLWLLNHYLMVPTEVMKLFAPPNVVAFSGHMIDQPGRANLRFPAEIEQSVKDSIRNSIRTLNARIGYSSLACGSDILFVEAMIEEGGEVNLMLPFRENDFIKTSLAFAGEHWVNRYKKILSSHPVHYTSNGSYNNNDELFTLLSKVIYGSAILRSAATHSEPYLITVSSEMDLKRKTGGTKDTIDRWPFPQRHTNINPDIFTVGMKPTSLVSEPGEKFETNSEILSYMVYAELDNREEFDKEIKTYNENQADERLNIIATREQDNFTVLSFSSASAIMEFIIAITNSKLTEFKASSSKLVLHVGITCPQSHGQLTGSACDEIISIGRQVSTGSIFASDLFASLLALNVKEYQLQYAGVINFQDQNSKPFYSVELLRK